MELVGAFSTSFWTRQFVSSPTRIPFGSRQSISCTDPNCFICFPASPKRPAGWRLLVYQEVKSLDAPATVTPGAGKNCENPCGAVPYTPKTATEREVMDAYKSLEEAAMGGKAREWSEIAADEIALVSSNSDRTFDKPTRAAAIAKATLGGVAPTKLLSARLFDFTGAVVMTSQHQSDRGGLIQITRLWVKRDGRWQETLSYQTAVTAPRSSY